MDGVRALTRQVVHPSRINRELLGQMAVIAFACGMVFAGLHEADARYDQGWALFFAALLTCLLYLYGWTSWLWYTLLD